ncbi:hypothetical protein GCM10022270_01170 [Terriglobus aquaticus]
MLYFGRVNDARFLILLTEDGNALSEDAHGAEVIADCFAFAFDSLLRGDGIAEDTGGIDLVFRSSGFCDEATDDWAGLCREQRCK